MPSTGPRNASALLNNVASGTLYLIRAGDLVTVTLNQVKLPSDADGAFGLIATIPAGFRPTFFMQTPIGAGNSQTMTFNISGTIMGHRLANYEYRHTWTFITAEAWPTTVPGAAV